MLEKPKKRGAPRSGAPTLQDIAREAGVSAMAVSVVLNGSTSSTRVSDETRQRIHAAAAQLQYRPNAVARGLQKRRMDNIGVMAVVDDSDVNLYFLELLNGILQGADHHGQNLTVFSIHQWEKDEMKLLKFCDSRIDGMIMLGPRPSNRFISAMPKHTPLVSVHSNIEVDGVPDVHENGMEGTRLMALKLIELGHRRILYLAPRLHLSGGQERFAGYAQALSESGIPYDRDLMREGEYTYGSGVEQMTSWLQDHAGKELPTAVLAANDSMATGAKDVLTGRGYRVPEDVSFAGFDDSTVALMTFPPLASVRQPLREMGMKAVDLLMVRIQTGETPPSVTFAAEPVLRGSIGPARSESLLV